MEAMGGMEVAGTIQEIERSSRVRLLPPLKRDRSGTIDLTPPIAWDWPILWIDLEIHCLSSVKNITSICRK